MAYDSESLAVATEAFIRDVCDQCEHGETMIVNATDHVNEVVSELTFLDSQSEVNETLVDRFGEVFNNDPDVMIIMSGSLDFFWQVYAGAEGIDEADIM